LFELVLIREIQLYPIKMVVCVCDPANQPIFCSLMLFVQWFNNTDMVFKL